MKQKIVALTLYVTTSIAFVRSKSQATGDQCVVYIWDSGPVKPTERLIVCEARFSDAPLEQWRTGLVAVPSEKSATLKILGHRRESDGNWTRSEAPELLDWGWDYFKDEDRNRPEVFFYGYKIKEVSCLDTIRVQCWCATDGNNTDFGWSDVGQVKVPPEYSVKLMTLTPVGDLWHQGTEEGTFLGARCVAEDSVGSMSFLQWTIHRANNTREVVAQDDKRVFLVRTDERVRNENPVNLTILESYRSSMCKVRILDSSINWEATRDDHNVRLECRLVNSIHVEQARLAHDEKALRRSFYTTHKLPILSPVSKENTDLSQGPGNLLQAESHAYPFPTYVWWYLSDTSDVRVVQLNASTGPEPGVLDLDEVEAKTKIKLDLDSIYCNISNNIRGEPYRITVNFSRNREEPPEKASVSSGWQSTDNVAMRALTLSFSMAAAMGVATVGWLLFSEQRTARRKADLWHSLEEKHVHDDAPESY